MALPLTLTARVQAGHKLKIVAPELTEGEEATKTVTVDPYAPTPLEARKALMKSLLEEGAIPFIPKGRPYPPKPAIIICGQPVSETIIEERR